MDEDMGQPGFGSPGGPGASLLGDGPGPGQFRPDEQFFTDDAFDHGGGYGGQWIEGGPRGAYGGQRGGFGGRG